MGRFQFNPQQQKFERMRLNGWRVARTVGYVLLGSVVLALLYYSIFGSLIKSSSERAMIKETELMRTEYHRLTLELQQLDKVIDNLEERDRQIYGTVLHTAPPELDLQEDPIGYYSTMTSGEAFALAAHSDSVYHALGQRANEVAEALRTLSQLTKDQEKDNEYLPACFPLKDVPMETIGATVGTRIQPFYKIPMLHKGMDFLAGYGTDVVATAAGSVERVQLSERGSGNTVVVRHGNSGYTTVYAHLSETLVHTGAKVTRGMALGRVGSTGMSFAPHLHYEVLYNGTNVDPVHFFFMDLQPATYRQVMLTAYNSGQSLD